MSFFGIFDIFANPLILLLISLPAFLLVGILLGTYLSQPRRNRVLKIAPESGRGVELEVKEEDAVNAYCDPVGNIPPQRFIKRLQAISVVRKGFLRLSNYALWFGRYGTAYTFRFGSDPIKISLKEAVMNIFGKELYDKIPETQKAQIEKNEVGVVVEFPNDPLTPANLPSLSEDDIARSTDDAALTILWKSLRSNLAKTQWMQVIFILGTGIGIGLLVGWFLKISPPIIVAGK